ncbi:hypothetical protein KP509_22G035800 [Ceratopteris richardii]|uniref:Syntaxin 6/10/61 N-terminal domain-containing protein n=1 Tax=Ceratopteris richardii TaxID=49495 RepID=A0A8T2S6M9_CERRI|nr:hypothetical protein KP509_22G035800 [Ceratopteris richardii]
MTRDFHRWEVDPFFSAAEEVQDSADRLESVYRKWIHLKSVGGDASVVESQRRELSTALGTAKWQLEEFERAVSCSFPGDKDQVRHDGPSRHQQFVDALQTQIGTIEAALPSSENCTELKLHSALRLGDEEKDELELFLCGKKTNKEKKLSESSDLKRQSLDYVSSCPDINALNHKNGLLYHVPRSGSKSDVDSGKLNSDIYSCTYEVGSSSKKMEDSKLNHWNTLGKAVCEMNNPISDPVSEYFHGDKGETCQLIANGHHRIASLGSDANSWRTSSASDVRRKRKKLISVNVPSARSSLWASFAKACYLRKFRSGLKRWKDGDANPNDSEMLALMQEINDIEQFGTKKNSSSGIEPHHIDNRSSIFYRTLHKGLQMWQHTQDALPSIHLVKIATAIIVTLGLLGLFLFHVS